MKAGWKYKVYTCITCHNKHVKFTMSQFLCSSVKIITKALQGISLLYILYITKWAGILFAITIHACVLKNRFHAYAMNHCEYLTICEAGRPTWNMLFPNMEMMTKNGKLRQWVSLAQNCAYSNIHIQQAWYRNILPKEKEKYGLYTRTEERNMNSPQEAEKARQKRSKWG